jgi:signal transduction histidine kinase
MARKIFQLLYSTFLLLSTAYSQISVHAVDDFERMLFGDSVLQYSNNVLVVNERTKSKAEIGTIVRQLDADYQEIAQKNGYRYDSAKANIFFHKGLCYLLLSRMNKSNEYDGARLQTARQTLHFARKAKMVMITTRTYSEILYLSNSNEEKIKVLNEWINDYIAWLKKANSSESYGNPFMSLSSLYQRLGDDEKELETLNLWLKHANNIPDKIEATSPIVRNYIRNRQWEKVYSMTQSMFIYAQPYSLDLQSSISMASCYNYFVESKLELKDYSDMMVYINMVNPVLFYNDLADHQRLSRAPYWKSIKNYLSAKYFLAIHDPVSAGPFLDEPISQNDADKLFYDYHKQLGDTIQAFRYLEKYAAQRDTNFNREKTLYRNSNKQRLELLKDFETKLIKEEAIRASLLQKQQLDIIKAQADIERIKAEGEKKTLLAAAENTELKRRIENEKNRRQALKSRQEQQSRIAALNIDIAERNRTKIALIAGLSILLLFAGILFFQNRQKQKANSLLVEQKNEIQHQRDQITLAMTELKAAQAQLVQSEKMASLGELTAGIAHEIQNPLNFVNNFSELNKELVSELVDELEKGNTAEVKLIATDLKENSEKISHHGNRAGAIVKGMLQHSRSSSGTKELTDINALCDEYLRLAYHGLRAKDKSFNANFESALDSSIRKVNMVPQEMGRVMLNLINNAFYAVSQRQKQEGEGYVPKVVVRTRQLKDSIQIAVKDNGTGIPQQVLEKIFQPFFTTKPTGEGTGLGLSLSYDIVTKGHGGELKVETKEGEGTEFIIKIPITGSNA